MRPRKHATQKSFKEQTQRLMKPFVNDDAEHRSELDVSQIDKYPQREYHLTLSEEVIKHNCNQTLMETQTRSRSWSPSRSTSTSRPSSQSSSGTSYAPTSSSSTTTSRTDRSSRSTHFLDRTLFTIWTSPGHMPLSCAQRPSRQDEFHNLASSQIFSDISVLFVTPRHFQNVLQTRQGEKASATKQPIMTATPAFDVDALLLVEP